MTYRHNNTPRPATADVMAAFADRSAANSDQRPIVKAKS